MATIRETSELIQRHSTNIAHRANRVAADELCKFPPAEIGFILSQLDPEKRILGSNDPCGPCFNRYSGLPLWAHVAIYSMLATGSLTLLPLQLGAAVCLLLKGRWRAIWKEIPTPTNRLLSWGLGMFHYTKAPLTLVERSVQEGGALCVNRAGRFTLLKEGYSVVSHVWGETMGWMTATSWGPVELPLRKKGLFLGHLRKIFDRCAAEWLWIDVLAMPEIFEDMSEDEKDKTEELRVKVINSLKGIYARADKVIVLDSLLLRLRTGSLLDVAVILTLSRWMTRLWCFAEAMLAERVVLKTADSAFDLDEILDLLLRTVNNVEHRYARLLLRLSNLRPMAEDKRIFGSPLREDRSFPPLAQFYHGCDNRYTDVNVDQARALYPTLGLEWIRGWSLKEGLKHIQDSFPEQKDILEAYCRYRDLEILLPL